MKHTGWETGEGWKSKMSVSAGRFHSKASLLGLQMDTLSLSSHALYSVCAHSWRLLLFLYGLIQMFKAPPYDLINLS